MKILASSFISSKGVFLNTEIVKVFSDENWLKEGYQFLAVDYPKFHKMDNLSKMVFLTTEIMKNEAYFDNIADNDLELIFSNANASQHTDLKFIDSYQNAGNPSPSLFVYTLPNILTGELAIRNKWFGENTFFISNAFNANLFTERLHHSAQNGKTIALCGWVESKLNAQNVIEMEETFLFLVALNRMTTKQDLNFLSTKLQEQYTTYQAKSSEI